MRVEFGDKMDKPGKDAADCRVVKPEQLQRRPAPEVDKGDFPVPLITHSARHAFLPVASHRATCKGFRVAPRGEWRRKVINSFSDSPHSPYLLLLYS